MSHLEILLPFGLPPPELASDLLKQLHAPALALLLSRAASHARRTFDEFAHALPHEIWLADRLGLPISDSSPPVAAHVLTEHDKNLAEGLWFLVQPVHIHIARDHLVLTDRRQLALTDEVSRRLFDIAKPIFESAGKTLLYADPMTWLLRADDWTDLRTSTPDSACGHNIDIWMPHGAHELAWRKLQNEAQMEWHAHAFNEGDALPSKPVNSLWLWGAAEARTAPPPDAPRVDSRYWTASSPVRANAAIPINDASAPSLQIVEELTAPALATDWGTWLERMQYLDTICFEPIVQALKTGRLQSVTLLLSDQARLFEAHIGKRALAKFWIKPTLERLLA